MTRVEESEMVIRWFMPLTPVNATVQNYFNTHFWVNKIKMFLSEEWDPNLANGSFLHTSTSSLWVMGVVFLSSSALGTCSFFSATQKAGNARLQWGFGELLEAHPVVLFPSHICLHQNHADGCNWGSKTCLRGIWFRLCVCLENNFPRQLITKVKNGCYSSLKGKRHSWQRAWVCSIPKG